MWCVGDSFLLNFVASARRGGGSREPRHDNNHHCCLVGYTNGTNLTEEALAIIQGLIDVKYEPKVTFSATGGLHYDGNFGTAPIKAGQGAGKMFKDEIARCEDPFVGLVIGGNNDWWNKEKFDYKVKAKEFLRLTVQYFGNNKKIKYIIICSQLPRMGDYDNSSKRIMDKINFNDELQKLILNGNHDPIKAKIRFFSAETIVPMIKYTGDEKKWFCKREILRYDNRNKSGKVKPAVHYNSSTMDKIILGMTGLLRQVEKREAKRRRLY